MKVDVVISVYGKPWQTLCTLKTLMLYSKNHIDKIYLIKEKEQPYDEKIEWIYEYFDNLIVYTPKKHLGHTNDSIRNYEDESDRYVVRHQYAFEQSDKKFLFITHNDVLYTGDIIGDMLNKIGNSVGIGEIGQCWNCPANKAGLCCGEKFNTWNPTYKEIISFTLPHIRTNIHNIDPINPKPLPECRLNEWACLVNKELSNLETYPNGNTPFFGEFGIDSGTIWFKSLFLKGYNFIDYRENFIHSYWSEITSGYQTQLNKNLYVKSEENAKEYFENEIKNKSE